MTMKYAVVLAAALALALPESSDAQANPGGMPNVAYPTSWDDWIWCCYDSNGGCPDACARVNTQPGECIPWLNPDTNEIEDKCWYDEWGPESPIYIEQESGQVDAPTMPLPDDGLFDAAFVVAKCVMIHGLNCCGGTGVCGDPHFKTWAGDYYDYQGQCELKFLSAPDFGNGVGLDIHIRTKIKNSYSFVESAAIKIGNDVLEVGSWGEYFLNGVEDAELPAMLGGYPVAYYQRSEKEHVFDIFLGEDRRILIKNLKEWVSVHIDHPSDADFLTSVGMMGDFMTGARLARDGKTIINDENKFGQEWQVLPSEAQLFTTNVFEPAHPAKCQLPVVDELAEAEQRRMLAEVGLTREKAAEACAGMPAHKEFCIRDVLVTGDIDVAGAF